MTWQQVAKIALWVPVGVAFNALVLSMASVRGCSMQPTLNRGVTDDSSVRDLVLVDKYSIRWSHRYRRGDVVVLASPENPKETLVTRIVALEGDLIEQADGDQLVVPLGKCWVEGDNRLLSDHRHDSVTLGALPLALIEARVLAVLWPPRHAKRVQRKKPRDQDRVVL